MRELIVNGVPMRDPLGKWRPDYTRSSILSSISRAAPTSEQIGYDGVDASGPAFFTSAQETLVLNLQAASEDEYYQLLESLQSLFSTQFYTVQTAPRKTALATPPGASLRVNRTFNATPGIVRTALTRTIGSVIVERVGINAGRLTIVMERPGAFWQSLEEYPMTQNVGNGTSTVDLTLGGVAGNSTAPITEGYLRIRGAFASNATITIRDRALLDRVLVIRAASTLTTSQYLLIEMKRLNARLLTSDTWSMTAGTDARSWLELTGDGGFTFSPEATHQDFPATRNRYFASVIRSDSNTTALEIRARRSFL